MILERMATNSKPMAEVIYDCLQLFGEVAVAANAWRWADSSWFIVSLVGRLEMSYGRCC